MIDLSSLSKRARTTLRALLEQPLDSIELVRESELATLTEFDLRIFPNCGKTTVAEIKEFFNANGIQMAEETVTGELARKLRPLVEAYLRDMGHYPSMVVVPSDEFRAIKEEEERRSRIHSKWQGRDFTFGLSLHGCPVEPGNEFKVY